MLASRGFNKFEKKYHIELSIEPLVLSEIVDTEDKR